MTKLDGLDKLVADLRAMGKLDPKPIKVSLRRVAGEIIRDARAACPSKTVRNAYGFITKNESKFPTTVLIGVDSRKRGTKTMTAPALAQVIEYGTAARKTKKGYNRGMITAHPFIRPAFDSNKQRANETIKKDLIKIIEQQAKKNNLK